MCVRKLFFALTIASLTSVSAQAQTQRPVPGYVPPITVTQTADYVDDTRGVWVPGHAQPRLRTAQEFGQHTQVAQLNQAAGEDMYTDGQMDRLSGGGDGVASELERIAQDPGALQGGGSGGAVPQYNQPLYGGGMPQQTVPPMDGPQDSQWQQPQKPSNNAEVMPDGGVEVAVGKANIENLDMHNSLVRLREDRIAIRNVLQRMMDQIGGSDWNVVWDLATENAALPDMEISIDAHEPFMSVLNALLARIQTRSGRPLRVIRYDNTRRLIITDNKGSRERSRAMEGTTDNATAAVTERMLKEATVSLHYDEVPLVDAIENLVNQAGKGQWRLRVYAGVDQVLKPAHIEEPFGVAMERVLRLFNLKYEIFPGGKLVVVTNANRFGFNGIE